MCLFYCILRIIVVSNTLLEIILVCTFSNRVIKRHYVVALHFNKVQIVLGIFLGEMIQYLAMKQFYFLCVN